MLEKIVTTINWMFMHYIFIYASIFFISTLYSIIFLHEHMERKRYKNVLNLDGQSSLIPISILVPAYNEEFTIVECINSILKLNYPVFEIVIIDDGSTDLTKETLINAFNLKQVNKPIRKILDTQTEKKIYEGGINKKITLISKYNGGKADALNIGINISKYPYFVSIDADSILQKDSLLNIVMPVMEDSRSIAVGGNIKVANKVHIQGGEVVGSKTPDNWIVIMQIIEYYRVFVSTRVWLNRFNANLIISGAFGLFKKEAVINVGGYDTGSIGEDMGLVVKLHAFYRENRIDYRIQYSPHAVCWSQVPNKIKDFGKQRKRWQIGLMQSLFDHKYIFLNPSYGVVGLFSYVYFVIYEMLSSVIELLGLIFIIVAYYLGYLNREFFITFMLVYTMYGFVVSIATLTLGNYIDRYMVTPKIIFTLIFMSLFESIGYRQLTTFYRLSGIWNYFIGKREWNKFTRERHNESKDVFSSI